MLPQRARLTRSLFPTCPDLLSQGRQDALIPRQALQPELPLTAVQLHLQ
jgi:hypothetical protein